MRDRDPLAHAAAEVRADSAAGAARVRGCRPAPAAPRPARRAARRPRSRCARMASVKLPPDREGGIKRGQRVLEDHRHDRGRAAAPSRVRGWRTGRGPRRGPCRSAMRAPRGSRRMIASAVMLLPDPDSPTRPTACHRARWQKSTPRTTGTSRSAARSRSCRPSRTQVHAPSAALRKFTSSPVGTVISMEARCCDAGRARRAGRRPEG